MDKCTPSKITLRQVDLEKDREEVLIGIRDFVSRMDYKDFLPDTDEKLLEALNRLLDLGCVEILVAEYLGKLVGGIGVLYAPCIWNSDITIMEQLFMWVDRSAPATTFLTILRAVRKNARTRNCQIMTFKRPNPSPTTLDKIYRRMGMKPVETNYMGSR